jgi:hypothetical protein
VNRLVQCSRRTYWCKDSLQELSGYQQPRTVTLSVAVSLNLVHCRRNEGCEILQVLRGLTNHEGETSGVPCSWQRKHVLATPPCMLNEAGFTCNRDDGMAYRAGRWSGKYRYWITWQMLPVNLLRHFRLIMKQDWRRVLLEFANIRKCSSPHTFCVDVALIRLEVTVASEAIIARILSTTFLCIMSRKDTSGFLF